MGNSIEHSKPKLALRTYLFLTSLIAPLLERHLKKRLGRGKEIPGRWREKLGEPSAERPDGTLIWIHAVGLGEVLALRGLIEQIHALRPDFEFLVTSGTRASAEVFGQNMPPACRHQFLPLDSPNYVMRFFDHWKPDLSIWAEQELWPGFVWQANKRNIPLALVNARMDKKAYAARKRLRSLYVDLYRRFALFDAQDIITARHLALLGAPNPIPVSGSLKPAAAALSNNQEAYQALKHALTGRRVWLAASSHAEDEQLAIAAHKDLLIVDPTLLLIIAPRFIDRKNEILQHIDSEGLNVSTRSLGLLPTATDNVYLADTLGEMGLWYRLCFAAHIGGSAGIIGGHNPWEAAHLGCAILHSGNIANFKSDYAKLHDLNAAKEISTPQDLALALQSGVIEKMTKSATQAAKQGVVPVQELCKKLIFLLETTDPSDEPKL